MTPDTLILLSLFVWFLPLGNFVLLIFFHRRIPRNGDWIATSVVFGTLVLASIILVSKFMLYQADIIQTNVRWIDFKVLHGGSPLGVELGILIDNVAAIMLTVVTLVSALVHLFSIGYMRGDVRYGRYFAYLGLFTFSMQGIVLTNNFFLLYVAWELVGLSSYLLIGHWFEKQSASDAAKKAFVVNRFGDVGMFLGILILYATFHSFRFDVVFNGIRSGIFPGGSEPWLTIAGVLIFCGAIGKSAQFPLHVWLPDAMEGPTPVSALIHAATMVAAGVYMVTRTFAMMTGDALLVIAYTGAFTAFLAATIAVVQTDIKKVLAYSTVSQLGYMIMGLGVGAYTAGFFHLTTHAMFKAGLFLGAGSVIHAMHYALHHQGDHHTDPQDIRTMGGLKEKMPITFWTFFIYTLAISGVPFTSGFLSKDEILAGTWAFAQLTGHTLIPIVAFSVAGLTAFYMFRLLILTFLGNHADDNRIQYIHESPHVMTIPLIVFATLSFFIFYSFNPFSAAGGWFAQLVKPPDFVVPSAMAATSPALFAETVHNVHLPAMLLSILVAGLGILGAFTTYYWKKIDANALAQKLAPIYKVLLNKWYIDEIYEYVVVNGTKRVSTILAWIDNTIVDGIVNGVAKLTVILTHGVRHTWTTRSIPALLYIVASALLSLYLGWEAMLTTLPETSSPMTVIQSGIVGVVVSALSFFLFYGGVGGFDAKIVDGLVNFVATLSGVLGLLLRRIQTGKVQTYILWALIGVVVLFIWFR
ncbi:MAG: NADH-quinone oxidoreductase subunit L [Bacteroidetes bacterium]|nr:NADH-quinone oxidoreductase subunit L [Bacteroidota bacterium]